MLTLFVYEFVTGGGWWTISETKLPNGSLLREGSAMIRAIAADGSQFARVLAMRDTRCGIQRNRAEAVAVSNAADERRIFKELANQSDWTVVIAPEFDNHLLTRCRWVEESGGRLLSPGPDFVTIAGDKQFTAERLIAARIPMPRGLSLPVESLPDDFRFPAVLKPRDGCGSMEVSLVANAATAQEVVDTGKVCRLEEFHPGTPASVSVLTGPRQTVILPPSSQRLSDDGHFRYLGGSVPLSREYVGRATELARAVVAAMPPTVGYFGIDLVLGNKADGADDVVIEINPRLTTSYLGLRQLVRPNLAQAMLQIARGEWVDLCFAAGPVQFAADLGDES